MGSINALPQSDGLDPIWVIIDRLSKYSYYLHLRHSFNEKYLARVFNTEELHKLQGAKLKMSSLYHPESDSQGGSQQTIGNYSH